MTCPLKLPKDLGDHPTHSRHWLTAATPALTVFTAGIEWAFTISKIKCGINLWSSLIPLHSASTSCNNSSSTAGSIHLAAARAGADLLVVPARCSLSPGLGSNKRGAKASDSTHHSAGAGEAADRVGSPGTVENGWSTLSTR